MENLNRYNKLNEYLKKKFGEKTLKICIDGGFTCPNRDGKISTNGCIFCSEKGSGEHINSKETITKQVQNYFNSYKATRANKFIAYFQNFTNTYDTVNNLKEKYDAALIDNRIVALSIATRPDCINEEIAKLLNEYSKKYYVYVELGLQTANNTTANFINRGYENNIFSKAVKILNKYHIDVVTHIMIGLPNETHADIENTVSFINNHNIQGIKIHSTYIVKNTILETLYHSQKYIPMTLDYYIKETCFVLTHISPKIIIHKISGDAPKDLLIAPDWNLHKKWIINGIHKYLNANNLYQGQFYKNK